jgi:p-hydroxybenzoate 3-monooxygenase
MMHWSDDPFDAELQLSRSRRVTRSAAGATGLAENCAGLWIGYEYAGRRA